ncbi:hypothetical protein ACP70R_047315 [Stipagrostis hirtigluma subsp. patula]
MAAATAASVMRSSAGRALRSASAVVCKPVSGSHVLRIDGYSHLCRVIGKDEMVRSSAFDVGGHSWRIALYPNGNRLSKLEQHIGVFLHLDSNPSGERVWARPKFSVLDQLLNPGAVQDAGTAGLKTGHGWGLPDFISKEKLETPEFLKDDSVAIQCDVAVTTVRECSDHMVFISRKAAEPVATEA